MVKEGYNQPYVDFYSIRMREFLSYIRFFLNTCSERLTFSRIKMIYELIDDKRQTIIDDNLLCRLSKKELKFSVRNITRGNVLL